MKCTHRETAYRLIRRRLADGSLAPGVRLSPAALAREIGVSHIPIREAITQLQSEGFVEHQPHRGAFVKSMDRQELIDSMEIRTVLECHAAAQAARRISAAQLEDLDRCWRELVRLAEAFHVPAGADLRSRLADWLLGDLAFHMVIFRAAGNARAIRVLDETQSLMRMFGHRTDQPRAWDDPSGFATENLRVHEQVHEAIRRHDPRAARQAMSIHMRRARKNLLARYDWLQRRGNVEKSQSEDFPDSMREKISSIQHGALSGLASRPQAPSPDSPPD